MATTWKFYLSSQEAWEAMYKDCERAKQSIFIEQFIIKDEPATHRFFELFKKKASQGVQVRILADMVGSFYFYESPAERELRDAGVQVIFFHPATFWRLHNMPSFFWRDHRKIMVIDGVTAHVGGVGIHPDSERWRDTNIRLVGPVVPQILKLFKQMWEFSLNRKITPPANNVDFVDDFLFQGNGPHRNQRQLYHHMVSTIRKAKKYVYITTPYFIPPIRLFRAMRKATRRGLDVRLLIPANSNHPIVHKASQSFYGFALKSGIRLFQYNKGMIHAKTMVIDDEWGTIGSTNLDSQSFVFNYEANLVTKNKKCIEELKSSFLKDLESSTELKNETWKERPFFRKLLEHLTWPIHIFL